VEVEVNANSNVIFLDRMDGGCVGAKGKKGCSLDTRVWNCLETIGDLQCSMRLFDFPECRQ